MAGKDKLKIPKIKILMKRGPPNTAEPNTKKLKGHTKHSSLQPESASSTESSKTTESSNTTKSAPGNLPESEKAKFFGNFYYKDNFKFPQFTDCGNFQVHIPFEYLSTLNKSVRDRKIWGNEVYTDDSDPVCVLMHSGLIPLFPSPPNFDVVCLFQVCDTLSSYESSVSFGLESREFMGHDGKSIRLLRVDKAARGSLSPRKVTVTKHFAPFSLISSEKGLQYKYDPATCKLLGFKKQFSIFLMGKDGQLDCCLGIVKEKDGNLVLTKQIIPGKDCEHFQDLKWEDIKWTKTGVQFLNESLSLKCFKWMQ